MGRRLKPARGIPQEIVYPSAARGDISIHAGELGIEILRRAKEAEDSLVGFFWTPLEVIINDYVDAIPAEDIEITLNLAAETRHLAIEEIFEQPRADARQPAPQLSPFTNRSQVSRKALIGTWKLSAVESLIRL